MKIKSIAKRVFNDTVYNFHCLPNENYFSEGILTHNCYKSNGHYPTYNMNMDEFIKVLQAMPETVTQIAFGILNISSNPDFFNMMKMAKDCGVIPNYTCHGYDVTDEVAQKTSELCGAVAVSVYNKNASYNAIKKFTDNGMDQVNIHYMISEETYDKAFEIIDDMKHDERLMGMNAIVFLALKTKGGGKDFHVLSTEKYNKLVDYALEKEVPFGFDSCSAHRFLNAVKDHKMYKQFEMMAEPCESNLFSHYCNCKGESFPCSFSENHDMFPKGNDTLNCNNFIEDVWLSKEARSFRKLLLEGKRHCPLYDIG